MVIPDLERIWLSIKNLRERLKKFLDLDSFKKGNPSFVLEKIQFFFRAILKNEYPVIFYFKQQSKSEKKKKLPISSFSTFNKCD